MRTDIGTGTGLELGTAKRIELGSDTVIESGTGTGIERALTGSTGLGTKLSGIIRKNDDEIREETFAPTNYARFQYVVMATSVERSGKEVETVTAADIQNGKYPYGIEAFYVMPPTAKIGYDFTDNTNTNEKVAVLDENGKIKLTGEPGEATISVKSPDGKTVSKTVRVYQDFESIEISGIKAPVIGEKFDVDSIKVPDDALYHITNVKWEKSRGKTVGKDETAAYFEPYTICVTVEPNDFTRVADGFTSSVYETQADGTQKLLNSPMRRDFDEETNSYLNSYTFWYTYPAQTNHETKVIDKIYIDFPTEVKEGDNFIQWLEAVHVYTNGYDEGLEFKLTPTFGPDAEKIANAYGFTATSSTTQQLNYFIKGVQNGLKAEITIPDKMKETGDTFAAASDIKVYINGEEGGTFARMGDGEIWVMAPDTLTVTDGEFNPPKKPVYSVSSVDAVVGVPIKVKDLLVTDDPKVTIRPTGIYQGDYWDEYIKYDSKEGTCTPLKAKTSTDVIKLTYMVEYDENGDGYPEYQDSSYAGIERIYATAADVPKPETPPAENYGTAKIVVQNPDGREINKVDYKIRSYQGIPDPDGMFFIGFYDADGKTVSEYSFENGKTYYAKTVAADAFEIHAGVNSAYAFIRMPNGNTMSSIHISADGKHYLVGDYLRDLNPDTEYTLYYKHGADGKVYSKSFRTAKQDYGVMLGHDFVTDANPGNLEKDGWHYDADTKTLTLKNFNLRDFGAEAYTEDFVGTPIPVTAAIASKDAMTLNLIGDNRIAFSDSDLFTSTIFAEKDLTITGNGNLTIAGTAQFGLHSHTGNICLNGTGTLMLKGGYNLGFTGFYPEGGEVLYTNGTIAVSPMTKTNYKDEPYQFGFLIEAEDAGKLKFSGKVHDIKIEAAGLDGEYEAVAESDLAALIQENTDHLNASKYDAMKCAIRITPVHKDVNKIASAETHESGTCDSGCTYHLSCDCGHIGEETFIMSAEEHSLVKHAAKAAACEEPGTAAYWECEICGERYADAKGTKPITDEALTVPALGHKLTHHAGVEATC
ncbi:MAG: hypothetical protein IKG82_02510, partial [Oscillospiraceae bacterium]|nr:hypothetical protein [Oscillospiraceae bacterium]